MPGSAEREQPELHSLQGSVACVANAMFSALPATGACLPTDGHHAIPRTPPLCSDGVKLEEIDDDEDLFADYHSNAPAAQPGEQDDGDEEMFSQASQMMSFSQVAQGFSAAEGQDKEMPSEDKASQNSEELSFTQILSDVNEKMEKHSHQDKNNRFASLFSSASGNVSQESGCSETAPQAQQAQNSFTSSFAFPSHPRPTGGVHRPVPLVPLTPFSTNNQYRNSFGNFDGPNTFSARGFHQFSSSSTQQGNKGSSDNVPSFARAPPFSGNFFQSARNNSSEGFFSSADRHNTSENIRSNNPFLSAASKEASASSFLQFSQPFSSCENTRGKENQPKIFEDTQAAQSLQKAGSTESQHLLRNEDQCPTSGNKPSLLSGRENESGRLENCDPSSNDHVAPDAKPDAGPRGLPQSAPTRPVFGKAPKITPSFKPVFKKNNVRSSSSSTDSISKPVERKKSLERANEETGMTRKGGAGLLEYEEKNSKQKSSSSSSQVFKTTHEKKKNFSSTSTNAQCKPVSAGNKVPSTKISQEAREKQTNGGNMAMSNGVLKFSTSNELTKTSSKDAASSTSTSTAKDTASAGIKCTSGNAPLKMKKTDSVPRPKIMVKSEKELCVPDSDDFLSDRAASAGKEKKPKKNVPRQISKEQRGSHLENFKRKMSFLYEKATDEGSKPEHSNSKVSSLKEKQSFKRSTPIEAQNTDLSHPCGSPEAPQGLGSRSGGRSSVSPGSRSWGSPRHDAEAESGSSDTFHLSASVLATAGSDTDTSGTRTNVRAFSRGPPLTGSTPPLPSAHQSFTSPRHVSLPLSESDSQQDTNSKPNSHSKERESGAIEGVPQNDGNQSNDGSANSSENSSTGSRTLTTHGDNKKAMKAKFKSQFKKIGCSQNSPPISTVTSSSKEAKTPWLSRIEKSGLAPPNASQSSRPKPRNGDSKVSKPRPKRPARDSGAADTADDIRQVQDLKTHMLELQQATPTLVYVRCDDCNKWRQLRGSKGSDSDPLDPADLPDSWTCSMNPDTERSSCEVPEEPLPSSDPDHYVLGSFALGSVVWVRQGSSFYPAMVDDDPDTDTYFWLPIDSTQPNWYHVTYFESPVSRNWVRAEAVSAFTEEDAAAALKGGPGKSRSDAALLAAATAKQLPLVERRQRYCFAARYKGPWFAPAGGVAAQPRKRLKEQNEAKKTKKRSDFVFYKNK